MRFNYSWIPFIVFIPIIILFGIYYLNQASNKEGFNFRKLKSQANKTASNVKKTVKKYSNVKNLKKLVNTGIKKLKRTFKKKGVCVPKTNIFNRLKKSRK
jgi:ATP-dependent Zn protease